ncbi:MAG: cell surface protein SprA [Paludibacter sp.]|nr:cell surface protein SprA [Paludibacter sp.]
MIFSKKTLSILFFCGIVLSSAYAFVSAGFHVDTDLSLLEEMPVPATPKTQTPAPAHAATPTPAVKDTTTGPIPNFPIKKYTQNSYEDIEAKYPMDAPNPKNVKSMVEYDAKTGNYILRTFVGENEIASPFLMTAQEYRNYSGKLDLQRYWKEKNGKVAKNNEDKFSVSDMKFNIGPADKVFGPGGVQIKTQGSAELVFGYKSNKLDNPALTERMRKTGNFNFDEKIQLNVTGSVGDKVSLGLNYNTESSFDFDQKMVKLAYKGKEDDIIKTLEAGNVSLPLNSSLISGSTALFGIKTEMQFGKLSVAAIATQQQSQTQTVSSKGGTQTTKFEVNIDKYDDNRHFFLAHFFRDNYENWMKTLPHISSGVTVNRVEVWITNKRANYDQARNIVAFMDLAETDEIDNKQWKVLSADKIPQNTANDLYSSVTGLQDIRDVQKTNSVLYSAYDPTTTGINGGEDYEKIESARRLDPSEYTLNRELGTISLRNTLNPDEVLAVAYEYTYRGQTHQVGEFSTDAINAPNALVVKLLKSTSQSPKLKLWDLMMKNVYDLGAMDIQQDNFKLNVVYRNDSIGTDMQYITEGAIKNKILLRVMNLDRLDSKQAANPDGKFDFIEGSTILASSGRVIFPVLEPFGSDLRKAIGNDDIAKKYVYQELYDSTLVVAQEFSERNKFKLTGEYKASSGSEIRLNAMNVPRGSVTVTAGGATLVENVDYTVDYTMGTVTILNQSLIASGTKIDVKLENQSMFSMQRKSLVGTHLEYKFDKDFSLGGTIMHLSEMPLTTKVNTGSEPISNTIWGLNTSWRTESQWLTNVLDKIPFVNATKPSTIALNAEFAQLIPGHSSVVSKDGLAYIDDFESTKTTIDIHYPINWYLASTPTGKFSEGVRSNDVSYGKNRALLAWYYVDPLFNNKDTKSNPTYIRTDLDALSNNLTREVLETEIFPNKQIEVNKSPRMTIMNLSYYPTERGPYNLDVAGMNADGTLTNPKGRWGGIMRKLDATDFDASNIEYIEFWMMDPFVNGGMKSDEKGELYFNLGDISEDVLKDGKKSFEHGLPIDGDETKTDATVWGRVPKTQSTVTAFSGDRKNQDVGLDGLPNDKEFSYPAYGDYLNGVKNKMPSTELDKMNADQFSPLKDPAGDNYHFYRGTDYDEQKLTILQRYKHYNGTEGNSPDATNVSEQYTTNATSLPDNEDINGDNTLNEYEKYYQYRVKIDPNAMSIGSNFITDKVEANVNLKNGKTEKVNWYQFKIPIRENLDPIGGIRNFKSIRFIRMFLTGFEKEAHLRLATLDLVRGEWRKFNKILYQGSTLPTTTASLDVQAVNIEENASKSPVNYVLPPGVTREVDPGQQQLLQLNEQSMVLRVTDLATNDARGVYKNTAYDMRQYKRLQMFVHAEKMAADNRSLNDGELTCFVRIGSDMVNNYYEYEIPLKITPAGLYNPESNTDRNIVWYPENKFDFPFEVLTNAKLARNKDRQSKLSTVSNSQPYVVYDNLNKISIVGNPSISDVSTIMIGVRNSGKDRTNEPKSGEIWVNELRMSQFDESGGWAAMGNLAVGLSDLGTINFAGRIETAGYGSIESNVTNRRKDDLYQMNFSTALELGRFLPQQVKLQIPAYFSYTNETLSPKYNPLDQDVLLSNALNAEVSQAAKDTLKLVSQTVNTTKSFNISGAKVNIKSKNPQFYDPANVTFAYALNETNQHSAEIERNFSKDERASVNYSFSFNPQPFEPFKSVKALDKPLFKIIKDFNLNYMPLSVSFNTNMDRRFSQVKLRDLNATSTGVNPMDLTFSKDFMWNRQFDIKYDLTKAIKFSFQTAMNSNISEGDNLTPPEIDRGHYEQWRDTVWSNIKKLGTPYTYQQVFTASWTLPINKIPLFDWINANASYNSDYKWDRMAKIQGGSDIGNIAKSTGAWQADGQFNFESLYSKSKFLKDVTTRTSQLANPNKQKFQSKTYTQQVNLEKGKLLTINHRLGSDKFRFTAVDKQGNPVALSYKVKNATTIEITPPLKADSILLTLVSQDPNVQSPARATVDFAVRALMLVRRASITYRESNSMVLPGFKPQAGFLGQQSVNGVYAPGYAFTFGLIDKSVIENSLTNNWLYESDSIVTPATSAFTSDLDVKVSLEPFAGFKIDLNAKRYEAKNTSILYMFAYKNNGVMPTTYTGSYNITLMALGTAFKPIGTANQNYSSVLFDKLLANRQVIKNRLDAKYVNTNYPEAGFLKANGLGYKGEIPYNAANGSFDLNSADVLIPSFLAAYTGRDINTVDTNPFLSFLSILPNWRISYDGLSNIGWIKDKFKSVSLTHAYTCRYSIGSYTSYSTWVAMSENNAFGYVSDVQNAGNALPSSPYDISDVSINEQFSPLIGVNVALKNSMTGKLEYRKQRNLALNLSSTQLIESTSDEFVVGMGYLLKDFDVILKLKSDQQTKVKNDLKLSADLSYKDIKTLLRKVQENITQASSGNKVFSLKIIADYVFSSKVNIQLFYDRQASTPLISSSYPVSSSNFGVSFKFMLTR